jgi:hypothetical protein
MLSSSKTCQVFFPLAQIINNLVTRFDRDVKNLSLPSLGSPKISYFEEIEDLKKQLKIKDQLIKNLSMEIMGTST